MIPVERTHEFSGRYHVLGGALSPIDGVDPEDLRIEELLKRVEAGGVREVVVATNSTTTGEATALYLADTMRERAPAVTVTRLPAACRWAPTSSTPTRSRSARRSAAAGSCDRRTPASARRSRASAMRRALASSSLPWFSSTPTSRTAGTRPGGQARRRWPPRSLTALAAPALGRYRACCAGVPLLAAALRRAARDSPARLRLRLRRPHGVGVAPGWVLGGTGLVARGTAGVGATGGGRAVGDTGGTTEGIFVRGRNPLTSPYSRFSVSTRVTASSSRARGIGPTAPPPAAPSYARSWPRAGPEM